MIEILQVPINELKFADYNPRKITERQVEHLKASIEKFGVVEPIVMNVHPGREFTIVGGHQRVRIMQMLGYDKVPVIPVDLDEQLERELNIRLNKNTGEFDWNKLANLFEADDLISWGFNEKELLGSDTPDFDTQEEAGTGTDMTEGKVEQTCPACGHVF